MRLIFTIMTYIPTLFQLERHYYPNNKRYYFGMLLFVIVSTIFFSHPLTYIYDNLPENRNGVLRIMGFFHLPIKWRSWLMLVLSEVEGRSAMGCFIDALPRKRSPSAILFEWTHPPISFELVENKRFNFDVPEE
ncbi:hypothetical protein BLNAU_2291 [Blattamonas nauphoetae]|uniref:Uncharacterized protein n=1 Tax=Blattamonas nauphoetae TaxID=2049346 RepID=A0ABQ9YGS5_9EUKA|nr:hypothetical protein BLNAU_2291 [Blattamonas nauphoetae]